MNPDTTLVVIDGLRTPFARMGTAYAGLPADELGRQAVQALLARTAIEPGLIDEVILGCVCQPPESMNIARVVALRAGVPRETPALTVHRNCASGLEAVLTAADRMAAGRGSVFIVGGVDNMSRVPLFYPERARKRFESLRRAKSLRARLEALMMFRPADFAPEIGLLKGLTDPVSGLNMGETAEVLAREHGITRAEQDAYAVESHRRALAAAAFLDGEITPVYAGESAMTADNGPRPDCTPEALAALHPVFDRKYGTVTAGNSSQITDGAVAMLVTTETRAKELGLRPLGRLLAHGSAGCDPARMGLGPVPAIRKLGIPAGEADIVEINEAFAVQTLAVQRELGDVPHDRLNVNGGAIALGHPVGASGARLVLTALRELRRRQKSRALVSLCVGGGQGTAAWLEAM